jgi:hypothetical protein
VPELLYGRIDGPLGLDSLIHTTPVDDRRTRGRSVGASVLALKRHRPSDGERGSAVLSSELPLQCRAQLGLRRWHRVSKIPYGGISRVPNPTARFRAVRSRRCAEAGIDRVLTGT